MNMNTCQKKIREVFMKMSNLSELTSIVCILVITYSIVSLINNIKQELANPIEYQYKDFSSNDIEQAMKYHGTKSCIIREGQQPYFVDKDRREIILFTDSCIEYLYKQKQRELK